MWAKDTYQEQLLGYLGEVEAEIERFGHARLQPHDLRELYIDLDIVAMRLWQLIGTSEVGWEPLRNPLEISCDQLQQAFYGLLRVDVLSVSTSRTSPEKKKWRADFWQAAEMLR